MAGSRKAMLYTSDAGVNYAVEIDESNGESTGFLDVTSPTTEGLPRNITMRYANTYREADISQKRRFWIGSIGDFVTLRNAGIIVAPLYSTEVPENWVITSVRGERVRIYQPADTGLQDGDAT